MIDATIAPLVTADVEAVMVVEEGEEENVKENPYPKPSIDTAVVLDQQAEEGGPQQNDDFTEVTPEKGFRFQSTPEIRNPDCVMRKPRIVRTLKTLTRRRKKQVRGSELAVSIYDASLDPRCSASLFQTPVRGACVVECVGHASLCAARGCRRGCAIYV